MLTSILGARLSWHRQRLGFRTCHRRARHRRLHPERGATRRTACHPALLLPAGSSGSRDHGLVRGKWRARPYHLVFRDTDDAPLRALPAWLAEDMTVYRGDNQDPAFIEKIRKLISQRQDWPRHILNDDGYFKVI